jgi:hypothetical protein
LPHYGQSQFLEVSPFEAVNACIRDDIPRFIENKRDPLWRNACLSIVRCWELRKESRQQWNEQRLNSSN